MRVLHQSLAPDVVAQSADPAQDRLSINRYRQSFAEAKGEFALEAPSFRARLAGNVLAGRIVGDREETVVIALEEICQGGIIVVSKTVDRLHDERPVGVSAIRGGRTRRDNWQLLTAGERLWPIDLLARRS